VSIKIDKQKLIDGLIPEYMPFYDVSKLSCVYYDGANIVCHMKVATDRFSKFTTYKRYPVYGTYRWRGRISGLHLESWKYPGSFEALPFDGSYIQFLARDTYRFGTHDDVASEWTDLTGQDWTVEREFKVVWDATKVEAYIDGALVATHTTRVPPDPQMFFAETTQTATGTGSREWVSVKYPPGVEKLA